MLKYTKVKLKLLDDIEIVLFIEKGIRGEISQCSIRYAVANNQLMKKGNYDLNNQLNILITLILITFMFGP